MRKSILVPLFLALVWGGNATAQSASYVSYGTGCLGPCDARQPRLCVPELKALDMPRAGRRFRVTATLIDQVSIRSILLTGSSRDWLGSLRLPLHLPLFRENCWLWTSGELAMLTRLTLSDPVVEFQIPNDKSLLGVHFYQQWVFWIHLIPSSNWFFSQGGHGVIGT